MYSIRKEFIVETAHILDGSYSKECQRFHGHSAKIVVALRSNVLDANGMIIDFKKLKEWFQPIYKSLDHRCIISRNTLFDIFGSKIPVDKGFFPVDFNPTAENLAKWIYDEMNTMLQKYKLQLPLYDTRQKVIIELSYIEYWETAHACAIYTGSEDIYVSK